jgi:hypothetical protein
MVKTASTMLALGTKAPDFSLPNIDGRVVSLSDFDGESVRDNRWGVGRD